MSQKQFDIDDTALYQAEEERRTGCPYPLCTKPKEAASEALKDFFAILGYDIKNTDKMNDLREAINAGKNLTVFIRRFFFVLSGSFALSIAAIIYLGIKAYLGVQP